MRRRLVHLTTTDMSLDWLLGPQLQAFSEAGYEVIGVSAPGDHVPAIEARGVRHVGVPELTRSNDPLSDFRAIGALSRTVGELRPDILHTHNPKPGVLGRIIGRLRRVPLVVNTQHGLYAQPDDRAARRLPVYAAERLAASFSHLELVQNAEDVTTLVETLRVPARRVRLLGNGIDLNRFRQSDQVSADARALRHQWGIGDHEIVCGVVGRLVAEKGLAEILDAAARLRGHVRFVWVGPTDDAKSDAARADEVDRAADQGVVFAGERTDMPACYSTFDVFAMPSWREGFPRGVMEASAMSLPVVASDIRGNRQAVVDGETGRIVPVREPAALAEAILSYAQDESVRRAHGASARVLAEQEFDQRRVIDRTLAAYELLDSRSTDR